jgi:thioredoxin 1
MPVREMLIAFMIVLGVGAFVNGMPPAEDPIRDAMSDVQQPNHSSALTPKGLLDSPLIAIGTDDNFKDEVLASKKPVLVEFYVDSDPRCSNMAPTIANIANNFQDSLKVVKVDLMNNPVLFKKYELGQLPGLIIFKNGAKVQALAGEMTETDLDDFLSRQGIKAAASGGKAPSANNLPG